MAEEPIDLGNETTVQSINQTLGLKNEKEDVSLYDIFRLAKGILIVAAAIYLFLALIKIFYTSNNEGIKEVWEYSKVVLNSIVSLVLGLYFGSNREAGKHV